MKPKDMLTYRAPRSTREAFHNTAEYGSAIERPQHTFHENDTVVMVACAAGAIALVFLFWVGWL